ncbi:MAG: type II secretion system protein [Gemmatirosa sp.]
MTLLEALVALVILGLTATGFLEGFRAGNRTAREAAEWSAAVAAAEATLEGALLEAPPADSLARWRPRVTTQPWEGAPRAVDVVAATVTLPHGAEFTLRRLVRRAPTPVETPR